MKDPEHLRPLERRVLAMRREGITIDEIAAKLRRSSDHVRRIIQWTTIPRSGPPERLVPPAIERRVVAMRTAGEPYEKIAKRFRRHPRSIRQIEGLTYVQHGLHETVFDQGMKLLAQNAAALRSGQDIMATDPNPRSTGVTDG